MKEQERTTYLQCQCGEIIKADWQVPLDVLYVKSYCPQCNEEKNMINIGENVWDKYWFGDIVADKRYYEYD